MATVCLVPEDKNVIITGNLITAQAEADIVTGNLLTSESSVDITTGSLVTANATVGLEILGVC